MPEYIFKIIKFGLTGALGIIIDFGTTWICKEKLKWNKYISNSMGFCLAVLSNFFINRFWTFKSTNPSWHGEFEKFLLFSLVGLLLNNGFIYLFHHKLKWNFYLAKLTAIGLVFIWNFGTNFYFNFK